MIEQFRQFLREVKVELKKVSWPSRDDLTGSTTVVIMTCCLVAIYIFFVDEILKWSMILVQKGLAAVMNLLGM